MSANVESMFYFGETPWHKLGTKVDHCLSSEEAIKVAKLDWDVVPKPLYDEKHREILVEGNKILFAGRVSEDEERGSKLICSGAVLFEEVGMQIWLQFEEKSDYEEKRAELEKILSEKGSEGNSSIFIYVRKEKQIKKLSEQIKVEITSELLDALKNLLGEGNVKLSSEKVNWRF